MVEEKEAAKAQGVSRRLMLTSSASAAATFPLLSGVGAPSAAATPADAPDGNLVEMTVNGQPQRLRLDLRMTLLDVLREKVGLTGTKKGCDHGQCGACTVHVGGRRILSCLTLAAAVREPVTTIEGVAGKDGGLHPMQVAFLEHDAFQCGYCTPGQIMSAIACVNEGHADRPDDIREWMSGNLCRCAAYPNIVAAVAQARGQMKAARS